MRKFELEREMKIIETFILDSSSNNIEFKLWDKITIEFIEQEVKSFVFGVNTQEDYEIAKSLGVYAVFSDCPLKLKQTILIIFYEIDAKQLQLHKKHLNFQYFYA